MDRRGSDQVVARKGDLSPLRRGWVALAAFAHLPVLLLLVIMIVAVLGVADETVQVGRRGGPYVSVPTLPIQIAVLAVVVPLSCLAALRVCRGPYLLRAGRQSTPTGLVLAPSEFITWRGRQGWRGIDRIRLGLALLAGVGPALYGWWLWRIWTASDPLAVQLFWSFGATVVLGGSVTVLFSTPARELLNDLFGTMVVTNQRIVWCNKRGHLYRQMLGADLSAAAVVEGDQERAWITLTHIHRSRVSELDLFGVPRPTEAMRAIERMVVQSANNLQGTEGE